MEFYHNEEKRQTAVLVGIDTGAYDAEDSLAELKELADTAGADTAATVIQKLAVPNNATYVGAGKLDEIKLLCEQTEADLLIFDDELSGAQIRNIEDAVKVRVVDRTMLILDIFALRARSKEGKLQVELAQQKYLLPRLIGLGKALSRQGGGIGTRGPGETKLESDRRHIRRRIDALTEQLKELEQRRQRVRQRRKKNEVPAIAIVGYTNAGKSTLLNLLTGADVYAKDQLFATLDPTARELKLPDGQNAVIIDTVGFIRRLPHQLVEAFHSTLEEAADADLILNVCDISDPNAEEQKEVTENLLKELGCGDIPVITVWNKTDLYQFQGMITISDRCVFLSCKKRQGIDALLEAICHALNAGMRKVNLLIPYSKGALVDQLRRFGKVLNEEYQNDGILITANIDVKMLPSFEPYLTD
jgi:GTP-binding protein HflX